MEELDPPLEGDAFVVKESQSANIIIGIVILLLVAFSIASEGGVTVLPIWFKLVLVGFGILFIVKGALNKEVLRVDCNGIYHCEELVTNWRNFLQADVRQMHRSSGSISDDFKLILKYCKDNSDSHFISVIPLTNTQDQPEEAVLEAIRKHYELSQGKIIPLATSLQIDDKAT